MHTDLQGIDLDSHLHPFTNFSDIEKHGALVIKRASGTTVQDVDGRKYLDAMAWLWCCDVGYGRTEIAEAIAEQAHELAFFHSFSSRASSVRVMISSAVPASSWVALMV